MAAGKPIREALAFEPFHREVGAIEARGAVGDVADDGGMFELFEEACFAHGTAVHCLRRVSCSTFTATVLPVCRLRAR